MQLISPGRQAGHPIVDRSRDLWSIVCVLVFIINVNRYREQNDKKNDWKILYDRKKCKT